MASRKEVRFQDVEERPFLSSPGNHDDPETPTSPHPNRTRVTSTGGNFYLTAVAITCYFLSITFIVCGVWQRPSEKQCIRKLNGWSPMLEAVQYKTVDPHRMWDPRYMGSPSDRVEIAWDALWEFGSLGIDQDKLPLINKSITDYDWHHLPPSLGGGIQAFFEGFHQVHCLNLLRQYTYRDERDYSYLHAFVNKNVDIAEHVDHCLEMVRAKIMCEADTTPYPAVRDPTGRGGFTIAPPEGRRCRDYGRMVHWAHAHVTVPFDLAGDA